MKIEGAASVLVDCVLILLFIKGSSFLSLFSTAMVGVALRSKSCNINFCLVAYSSRSSSLVKTVTFEGIFAPWDSTLLERDGAFVCPACCVTLSEWLFKNDCGPSKLTMLLESLLEGFLGN